MKAQSQGTINHVVTKSGRKGKTKEIKKRQTLLIDIVKFFPGRKKEGEGVEMTNG